MPGAWDSPPSRVLDLPYCVSTTSEGTLSSRYRLTIAEHATADKSCVVHPSADSGEVAGVWSMVEVAAVATASCLLGLRGSEVRLSLGLALASNAAIATLIHLVEVALGLFYVRVVGGGSVVEENSEDVSSPLTSAVRRLSLTSLDIIFTGIKRRRWPSNSLPPAQVTRMLAC